MPTNNESTADWPDKLITTLNQLKIGSIEIGVHPVTRNVGEEASLTHCMNWLIN